MKRTTHSTRVINGNGTGKDAFGDGSPGVSSGTVLDASVMNAHQEELANIIELAGGTLSAASNRQCYDAIATMISLATGGAVSNAAYTNQSNSWSVRQYFNVNDAGIPFLEVNKTATDDSHAGNKWKTLATFATANSGYVKVLSGIQGNDAQFAITLNAYWSQGNQRWEKDINAQPSVGLFLAGASGILVRMMPANTPNWTTWSTAVGGTSIAGFYDYAPAKSRQSVLGTGSGMQVGGRNGGNGCVIANGTRDYVWLDLRFPANWTAGTLDIVHQQQSTTPSEFSLATITCNFDTPGPSTMAITNTATGPNSTGFYKSSLDLSAVTWSGSTKEYRLLWVPGSGSDSIQGVRMRDWKDAGVRNFL